MKKRNYDFVARWYPLLERMALGNGPTEARQDSLSWVVGSCHILLIGEGNGRFLAECVREKVGGSITVIDTSGKMLELLRQRIADIPLRTELKLVQADFCTWVSPEHGFDVIVTHFFLDLFKPDSQRRMIEKITALSTPGTTWMNAEYRQMIKSRFHRWVDWMQYRFDRLMSGIEADRHYDFSPIIRECGWQVREEKSFCQGTIYSQRLELVLPPT